MNTFGEDLLQSLNEALVHAKGEGPAVLHAPTAPMNDTVLTIDDGGVCVITLNRPARLNAINPALLDGLNTALARADSDERIGAIVLTGAGRAFCAGDDLVEQRSMRTADEAAIAGFVDAIQQVTRHIMFGDTPVVAAVRGWAVGGAFSWPVNCDFSVWSDDARGFFPELRIGLYPSGAVTFLLPLQVGAARAREMLYTSRKYTAHELLACGLASAVVPGDRLLGAAVERAQALAALPAQARRALKRGLVEPHRAAIEAALDAEAAAVAATMRDPDTYARIERESERGRSRTSGSPRAGARSS